MPTKKKTQKSVAVVFGPGQLSPAMKKAMVALQKKHHAKQLPILRAKAAAQKKKEEALERLKGIEVKDLHKAITLGLSYEEASYIAFDALDHLEIVKNPGDLSDGRIDEEWAEELLRYLVKKNDHSIHFEAEEDECEGFINWAVLLRPYDSESGFNLWYSVTERDHPDSDAEEDADTLNQFILEFYGIDAHKVNVPLRIKEIEGQIKEHKRAIRESKREIKQLESELEELKASL
jgi:hypothetical protein